MAKKRPLSPGREAARKLQKLDAELMGLLEQRQALAAAIEAGALPPDSDRLEAVLAKARKATRAELLAPALRELLAGERAAAGDLPGVAYLGPENTFSHHAAVHQFGQAAALAPVGSIPAVFEAVRRGDCRFGVVPLENSTHGRVSDTLQCFSEQPAEAQVRPQVCAELPMRIHHCLLGSGNRGGVTRVLSKPQALSQCRNWLATQLPQAEPMPASSTAEAAHQAKADPSIAAIASEQAAAALGLTVLARNIEDQPDNITRFAVIGPEPASKTGCDKTAIMFEAPHEPGALADAMAIFKRHKLNLTWIESFPIPGTRDEPAGARYRFFVELEGHQAELMPRRAIAALAKKAREMRVLGSYPAAKPIG